MSVPIVMRMEMTQDRPVPKDCPARTRRRLDIRGRVQGVGFRPFVYRLATALGLGGLVGNDAHGAFVEVEGPVADVETFVDRLHRELPPLARIAEMTARPVVLQHDRRFQIQASVRGDTQEAEITPDVAICPDCRAELFDPGNRRYRYPFINCTNCGPRYSIIQAVPYDRPHTTMSKFRMCRQCQAEYDDPADRRFHAQPNACPVCGPQVWMIDSAGREIAGDPIVMCARRLAAGEVIAIKGIGGFHLACRADDDAAVCRLRTRKRREAKPLALMVPSLASARELAVVDEVAAAALTDVTRPIVLVPRRTGVPVGRLVAPGSASFGLMLPYAPLHDLLFAEGLGPLVMTSGNPSEEPLCCDNQEALERLGDIADAFLLHDRDIERRVDDSVVLAGASPSGGVVPIRRARGFAPAPIHIPVDRAAREPILAVGGELKSAVCVLAGTEAVLSEHLGELSNPEAYRHFVRTIEQLTALLRVKPREVACDSHPAYAATLYARRCGLPVTEVQHHHAHVVSCLADNGIAGRVIGVSCDGTGYGPDGAIWGCEVLACDEADVERGAHLQYFPLAGGDAAARDPWRPAAGLLHHTFGPGWERSAPSAFERIEPEAVAAVARRLTHPAARIPRTSSLGRLFDAAGFLLGLGDRNRYEAEVAMALESAAWEHAPVRPLAYNIHNDSGADGPLEIDVRPMIRDLLDGLKAGRAVSELARAFHETVAAMLADAAGRVADRTALRRVVLSGGCFANRLLVTRLTERLSQAGFQVFTHRSAPCGDGGLALGQAVVAAERYRRSH